MIPFSEEEGEDPVVEVVRREEAIEAAQGQPLHLIRQFAVGIPVDDRYLVLLGSSIQQIIRIVRA
jgi:hypothetical protein